MYKNKILIQHWCYLICQCMVQCTLHCMGFRSHWPTRLEPCCLVNLFRQFTLWRKLHESIYLACHQSVMWAGSHVIMVFELCPDGILKYHYCNCCLFALLYSCHASLMVIILFQQHNPATRHAWVTQNWFQEESVDF